MIELRAGDAEVVVDPEHGGRVTSLRLDGHELLSQLDDPMLSGCYPMVPWAGRVRGGRFTFRGQEHQLPLGAPPHAIHGVGHLQSWAVTGPAELSVDLDWPFGGSVVQRFDLTASALSLAMTVTAGESALPVLAGWHPCFVGDGAQLDVDPTAMWERDDVGIPTGRRVPVPPGPWDDAFDGLVEPRIAWPDVASLMLSSSCPVWVVYDQDPRVLCVEPQTDAPDAFNREPAVLEPGETLALAFSIAWAT